MCNTQCTPTVIKQRRTTKSSSSHNWDSVGVSVMFVYDLEINCDENDMENKC